jgi:mitochondrial ATPase complex subunit ATP10
MKSSHLFFLRSILLDIAAPCHRCQHRHFHLSNAQRQTTNQNPPDLSPAGLPLVSIRPSRAIAPRILSKNFEAKPLGAPIGVKQPPKPSDDPIAEELRSMQTKTKDWKGRLDSNTVTRQHLLKTLDRSHIRDYRNITKAKGGGKFYLANPLLYKSSQALYWPNFKGRTLQREDADTTTLMKGRISIVSLFQRQWAYAQTQSYVGIKGHPELAQMIEENRDIVQNMEISMENVQSVSILGRLFEWNLRRGRTDEEQDRYFMTQGIPVVIRESLGIMNNSVGYVFLVDQKCKIRWSACAEALPEEKESLFKGLRSLINQAKR